MNKIKQHIYKAMFWLLPWLCAVPLASCSFDDDIDTGGDGTATLQLSITAREEGDLNTRVGTKVGQDNEYMHNLLVLFIQNGKVVKKFLPDLRYDEAAKVGNLKTWESEKFTLAPGTYTVYAFANIDTYYDGQWGSLTGLGTDEGKSLAELGVNIDNIVLDDPAAKLNFAEGKFIPMSAKEEVTVTSDTRNISIGLDRLVSKIRMSITGNAGTKVTALSFGGYADKIGLFSDTQVNDIQYTCQHIVLNGEENQSIQLSKDGTYQFADFYVNSSPANSGYKVTLNTDEKNGTTYTATTARKELPRNSIYPLSLNLTGYDVTLDLHCWVSPIGNVPVEVELSPDPDYYTCTIPEGCQFEFTVGVTPVSSSGTPAVTDLKSAWTFDETKITGLVFDNYTEGDTTVKGHVTASAGETFNLTFDVTWTPEGGNPTTRRYNVEITTGDIADFPFKRSQINTRASEFTLDYLGPEMLNMFKK